MTDRWEHINRIYDAAVEVEEKERATFLENACEGDQELRREVESLLAYDQQAQQLLDRPAMQIAAEKLAIEPPSMVGRKLGPYQVQVLLGSGGMGDVYRARDTRLNRIVAIKVLPRHLLERSDLRQRFEREARAIASLDHPHVCALYDIGHEGATDFLVMQYLDGETLSQRLRKGPLSTAEVVRYAIEIAGALEQAHRKGVVHRDLKPGNIMLTETGAKLLDFGLAKQKAPVLRTGATSVEAALRAASGLATKTDSLTEAGMILGTLEYMAPEQLEGKETDARTDIFALGVVMYEMATGQKAFQGDSKASLIAKILTFQPAPIQTIQPVSPPELDAVVQKCLAKKPEHRWQSANELASELRDIADVNWEAAKAWKEKKRPTKQAEDKAKPEGSSAALPTKAKSQSPRVRHWAVVFAAVLSLVIVGIFLLWRARQTPELPKGEPSLKALTSYSNDNPVESAAISPDGKYLAFCSKGKLFVQGVRSADKKSLSLPEGFDVREVSWFPDGTKLLIARAEARWMQVKGRAKWHSDSSLYSLSFLGGAPQLIVERRGLGSSVSPDGLLVAFCRFDAELQTNDIWLVGANGEGPRRIRAYSGTDRGRYVNPIWASNGERLFYIRLASKGPAIESCDLAGDKVTTIFSSNENARFGDICWAPDGKILFLLLGATHQSERYLGEIKVDAATGKPISEARRLTQWSGFSFLNLSGLSITADGRQLALLRRNSQGDIYLAEAEAGGKSIKNPRLLTMDQTDHDVGDWTADSQTVLFVSHRNGDGDIFKQDIGRTDAEAVVQGPEYEWHPTLSPDRAFILYLVSAKRMEHATRLLRVPINGGPAERVLTGEKIINFSCAREANLCVVVEEVDGKQVLTTFDPLKGRGEKLPPLPYPESNRGILGRGILSPQGRLIETMKSGSEGLYIRVRSLMGEPVREITFKNLNGDYRFLGWSLDGKGIYVFHWPTLFSDFTAYYAGLDGHSQVFWKRGTSPGWSFDCPVPSPDGRYFAFTVVTTESNAWMLENF